MASMGKAGEREHGLGAAFPSITPFHPHLDKIVAITRPKYVLLLSKHLSL